MKRKTSLSVLLVVAVGLSFSAQIFAKEKSDFTAFEGVYTGSVSLAGGGAVLTGTTSVVVSVPRNGKSSIISYNTVINHQGGALPLTTTLTLNRNKTISASNVLIGLTGMGMPGTGTWSQGRNSLNFSASDPVSGDTVRGVGVVKNSRRFRTLTLI